MGIFDDLLGREPDPIDMLREAAKTAGPNKQATEARIARLTRKSQWLIDRAYNKALADMIKENPSENNREAAHRLRRPERHKDEFAKKG